MKTGFVCLFHRLIHIVLVRIKILYENHLIKFHIVLWSIFLYFTFIGPRIFPYVRKIEIPNHGMQ